ncbi:hypothetical protein [Bacillus sp. FJAT-27245]|uniref:hypothetical protein n=1 Tax=Bacillus sp. FJAT-27245 TaxID=1684144 RepID=UPI0006A796E6|nr:hypothetical protein [Bacillus sp. FJAT-27245]
MANKFKILSNSFLILSFLLIIIMLCKLYLDYQNYLKHPEWSAPFSVHVIAISVTYGVPGIVALVLAIYFKTKASN